MIEGIKMTKETKEEYEKLIRKIAKELREQLSDGIKLLDDSMSIEYSHPVKILSRLVNIFDHVDRIEREFETRKNIDYVYTRDG